MHKEYSLQTTTSCPPELPLYVHHTHLDHPEGEPLSSHADYLKKISSHPVILSRPRCCLPSVIPSFSPPLLRVPLLPSFPPLSGRTTRWPNVAPAVRPDVESLWFLLYFSYYLANKELSAMIKSPSGRGWSDRAVCFVEENGVLIVNAHVHTNKVCAIIRT